MSPRPGHDPGASRPARRGALLALAVIALAVPAVVAAQSEGPQVERAKPAKPKPGAAPKPKARGKGAGPKLGARAWILVDPRDGVALAGRAAGRSLPIASATKLMTAHLALKRLRPKQRIVAPAYDASAAESILGLRAGEKMTARDLLYALVLVSANDAAAALAVGVSGSVRRFVVQMNRAADQLDLDATHFANPIGLDAPGNYSSAADLAQLAGVLLENRLFRLIADTPAARLQSGDEPRRITTRNTLLLEVPWVRGVKTGHTLGADYVLVGAGRQNGTTLVSAVLGAPSEAARDTATLKLLEYGFSLYRPQAPVRKGEQLADPKLDHRSERLALVAPRTLRVSARKGQRVRTRVMAPDEVTGPVEKGERIGRVVVSVDGRRALASPLVAADSAEAATFLQKGLTSAENPLILIPLGGFVILVGVLLVLRGRREAVEAPPAPFEPEEEEKQPEPKQPTPRRSLKRKGPPERTPEERRAMHEERMQRRRERDG